MRHESARRIETVELQLVTEGPSWIDDPERLKGRVLTIMRTSTPPHKPPGVAWWHLRQVATGRVSATTLRQALDLLLDEGALIETWLYRGQAGPLLHRFLLPDGWAAIDEDQLVRVRAHRSVLAQLDLEHHLR